MTDKPDQHGTADHDSGGRDPGNSATVQDSAATPSMQAPAANAGRFGTMVTAHPAA